MNPDKATSLQALANADAPGLEHPGGYDYKAEERLASELAKRIARETRLVARLEPPDQFQDGSLLTVISLLADLHGEVTSVSISKFGRLATIDLRAPSDIAAGIIRSLDVLGYVYVPTVHLDEPYVGGHLKGGSGVTWRYRFFSQFF